MDKRINAHTCLWLRKIVFKTRKYIIMYMSLIMPKEILFLLSVRLCNLLLFSHMIHLNADSKRGQRTLHFLYKLNKDLYLPIIICSNKFSADLTRWCEHEYVFIFQFIKNVLIQNRIILTGPILSPLRNEHCDFIVAPLAKVIHTYFYTLTGKFTISMSENINVIFEHLPCNPITIK